MAEINLRTDPLIIAKVGLEKKVLSGQYVMVLHYSNLKIKTMSKNQTSIEWLKKELEKYGSSSHLILDWTTFDELCEQAKQMEKQQIIDAYIEASENPALILDDAEQYYQETFNKI